MLNNYTNNTKASRSPLKFYVLLSALCFAQAQVQGQVRKPVAKKAIVKAPISVQPDFATTLLASKADDALALLNSKLTSAGFEISDFNDLPEQQLYQLTYTANSKKSTAYINYDHNRDVQAVALGADADAISGVSKWTIKDHSTNRTIYTKGNNIACLRRGDNNLSIYRQLVPGADANQASGGGQTEKIIQMLNDQGYPFLGAGGDNLFFANDIEGFVADDGSLHINTISANRIPFTLLTKKLINSGFSKKYELTDGVIGTREYYQKGNVAEPGNTEMVVEANSSLKFTSISSPTDTFSRVKYTERYFSCYDTIATLNDIVRNNPQSYRQYFYEHFLANTTFNDCFSLIGWSNNSQIRVNLFGAERRSTKLTDNELVLFTVDAPTSSVLKELGNIPENMVTTTWDYTDSKYSKRIAFYDKAAYKLLQQTEALERKAKQDQEEARRAEQLAEQRKQEIRDAERAEEKRRKNEETIKALNNLNEQLKTLGK